MVQKDMLNSNLSPYERLPHSSASPEATIFLLEFILFAIWCSFETGSLNVAQAIMEFTLEPNMISNSEQSSWPRLLNSRL